MESKLKEIMSSAVSHSLVSTGNSFIANSDNFKNSVDFSIISIEGIIKVFLKQSDNLLELYKKIILHAPTLSQAELFSSLYKVRNGLPVFSVEVILVFSGIINDLVNWCIRKKIFYTPFTKSLLYIDEKIKLSFHPFGTA